MTQYTHDGHWVRGESATVADEFNVGPFTVLRDDVDAFGWIVVEDTDARRQVLACANYGSAGISGARDAAIAQARQFVADRELAAKGAT